MLLIRALCVEMVCLTESSLFGKLATLHQIIEIRTAKLQHILDITLEVQKAKLMYCVQLLDKFT